MNNIKEFRVHAGMSLAELAERTGYDIVEISMAERQWPMIRLSVVYGIAEALEVDLGEVFPTVGDDLERLRQSENYEEYREAALEGHTSAALGAANIEPDPSDHYMQIKFRSGNEAVFRITASCMYFFKDSLENSDDPLIVFPSDCKYIALRRSTIREVTFPGKTSYAEFVSDSDGQTLVIYAEDSHRPERYETLPDGFGDELVYGPMLDQIMQGNPLPKFFVTYDRNGEDRILSSAHIEALEIPLSLTDMSFYDEDGENFSAEYENQDLEDMVPAGRA